MARGKEYWDSFFLGMAKYMSTASKDPSTQVGAIIVDDARIIKGVGYNGFPRGVNDSNTRLHHRPTKYSLVVHAEANAILNAHGDIRGCTLYVYPLAPCNECAKLIIQAGIKKVVFTHDDPRWQESCEVAKQMFEEADIAVDFLEV